MKRVLKAIAILAGMAFILLLAAFLYYLSVTGSARLDPSKLSLETEHVRLYDASGEEIETSIGGKDVAYAEFPQHLTDAFISVEDKRFYSHNGFDYRRIVKAALKNISSLSFREGASTISQQVIKNTHLSSEKTVNRKLKEFKLTRVLEKNYSKEEILELYLNSIYFGHSAFGIEDAAYFYFEKKPNSLTAAESALLAALVKSPNRYSPFKDAEKCLARRNFVLSLMHEQEYIDDTEYAVALTEPLPTQPHTLGSGNYYFAMAYEELAELFPDAGSDALANLRVYTAYDGALQTELEKIAADSDFIAIVRGNDGTVKALHTTLGLPKRLPGSTVKPLLVYGPAIEENLISPATPILDERTDFAGYSPDDAGGASNTYVSVRYALSRSVNIPAVKILNTLGVERGVSYLKKMGLDVDREDYSLALALGGMREGFTLQELVDSYATLANGGMYSPSGTVVRVEDTKGNVLYERKSETERVFSEDTSFLITDMLTTAAKEGTARKLKSLPFAVAAKTGTHEIKAGNLDAYTVAYTTEDVVAVWMGNADYSPVDASGGGLPANYTRDILTYLYRNHTPAGFTPPQNVERVAYDRLEYEHNHKIVRADPRAPLLSDPSDFFRTSNLPEEYCTRYSLPTIEMPQISVSNGSVNIVLCQAEYYDYIVKRENRGEIATIYSGKYRKLICDNSVVAGESYVYTVIPVYLGVEGTPVELPRIRVESSTSVPDNWWE